MKKSEFKRLLESGRKAHVRATQAEKRVVEGISSILGDISLDEIPSAAENADNLEEAIYCYMQYGEYNPDSLWDELQSVVKVKKYNG